VQVVTRSGSNFLHGSVYEYFRNEMFNANDANLQAVGESRSVMRRNVYGATLGGPLRKNKFFSSALIKVLETPMVLLTRVSTKVFYCRWRLAISVLSANSLPTVSAYWSAP